MRESGGRILHASLDVRDALESTRSLRGMFCRADGQPMTNEEVREKLLDCLQAGQRRLPVGKPCEGFSYETGCPGHEEDR